MIPYSPVASQAKSRMAQGRLSVMPSAAPPPAPDTLFLGYTGVPGFLEATAVFTVLGAAAWVGIRTGMSEKKNDYLKIAGWIGGVGAGLLGVLYLGTKSGVTQMVGIPAVRVSPT